MPVYAKSSVYQLPASVKRARGRPPNVGAAQAQMITEDMGDYRALKARNAPQGDITAAINATARNLIQRYGWDDPLHARSIKDQEQSVDKAADEDQQRQRDSTLKKVREEVKKIWRRNLLSGAGTAAQPSTDIVDLIKIFAAKPRRQQDYKIWAKSKPRPKLEMEVDVQHAAKVRAIVPGAATPPRISTWNAVASQWYKAASPKDKKVARKRARRAHRKAMREWEASASAMPNSPEEAIKFMEASQTFLSDLMHFFATRTSGIAVMFLSGPAGSSLMSALP
ncbi:unnamed protein product [Peniophora sp. CBMAI 1063]|nr:unnamed protein product [Peniophora sp. CBMAI 1063]